MKHLVHLQISDVEEFVADNHVLCPWLAFVSQRHYTDQLIVFLRKASQIPAVPLIMTFVIEEFILMLLALILVSIMLICLVKI